jgi:hypothetical protein
VGVLSDQEKCRRLFQIRLKSGCLLQISITCTRLLQIWIKYSVLFRLEKIVDVYLRFYLRSSSTSKAWRSLYVIYFLGADKFVPCFWNNDLHALIIHNLRICFYRTLNQYFYIGYIHDICVQVILSYLLKLRSHLFCRWYTYICYKLCRMTIITVNSYAF